MFRRFRPIAKFCVSLLIAFAIAAQAPLTDGKITAGEWTAIIIALGGSGFVWGVENKSAGLGKHEVAQE
jgi:hypothetical protein